MDIIARNRASARARKPRIQKTCPTCGQPFEVIPSLAEQQFCSLECRDKRGRAKLVDRTCPTCGGQFAVEHYSDRVYCSRKCANTRHPAPICQQCGTAFVRRRGHDPKFCSRQCYATFIATKPRRCDFCGAEFLPRGNEGRFCTPSCQQKARRRRFTLCCEVCGTEFETLECKRGRRRYCSQRCRIIDQCHSEEEQRVADLASALLSETPLREHTFDWLRGDSGRPMYVDIYFPSRALVIEYDGAQHRRFIHKYHRTPERFHQVQARDALKNKLLAEHGLTLVRISDSEPRTREHVTARLQEAGLTIAPGP